MSKTKLFQLPLVVLLFLIFALSPFNALAALNNSGKIFLQIEQNGEAWYANPSDGNLYYLGRPLDAFNVMKKFGVGISDKDISLIPMGLIPSSAADTDQDGLCDELENLLGTKYTSADSDNDDFSDKAEIEGWHNPVGSGVLKANKALAEKLKGKILIQVEKKGAGWYVNPANAKRYYLGRPGNAFEIMYNLGIGISNKNLAKLPINYFKETFKTDYYELKYPNTWSKTVLSPAANAAYNKIPIIHQVEFQLPSGIGYLNVNVLEGNDDHTLGDFNISAIAKADKLIDNNFLVGIKPAKVQKFKFPLPITINGKKFERGAQFFADIMISTKKFIHLYFAVYNEGDITLAESYFNKLLKDLKLIIK
ncbi:hypothetical protein HZB94_03875 [Candidatus Falkowbacteria bacterium]|nr:hypothetical protein [Candidatus Falkowbacteria bacterium]